MHRPNSLQTITEQWAWRDVGRHYGVTVTCTVNRAVAGQRQLAWAAALTADNNARCDVTAGIIMASCPRNCLNARNCLDCLTGHSPFPHVFSSHKV